jgi:hypothetical protein
MFSDLVKRASIARLEGSQEVQSFPVQATIPL